MNENTPRSIGSEVEALDDPQLLEALSRLQAELARRAMPDSDELNVIDLASRQGDEQRRQISLARELILKYFKSDVQIESAYQVVRHVSDVHSLDPDLVQQALNFLVRSGEVNPIQSAAFSPSSPSS